jgi:tRNA-dihydrouridine synthase 4
MLGAALMEKRELVRDMVVETRSRLDRDGWAVRREEDAESPKGRSVSVKIRIHHDLRQVPRVIGIALGADKIQEDDGLPSHGHRPPPEPAN